MESFCRARDLAATGPARRYLIPACASIKTVFERAEVEEGTREFTKAMLEAALDAVDWMYRQGRGGGVAVDDDEGMTDEGWKSRLENAMYPLVECILDGLKAIIEEAVSREGDTDLQLG